MLNFEIRPPKIMSDKDAAHDYLCFINALSRRKTMNKIRKKSVPDKINLTFCLILASIGLILMHCSEVEEKETKPTKSELIQPLKWWENLPRPVYASLERIETTQKWFEVYKLTEDTYAIYEPGHFEETICYLAIGKDKAAVIDSGTGIANLKQVVKELTDRPVFVLLTHAHWDHIGSNFQFDEIVCFNNPESIEKLSRGMSNESLREGMRDDAIWMPLPEGFSLEAWKIPPVKPTNLVEDGDFVDLGERTLEVIHTPGHSSGSICLLDKKNRMLFTGDTFFPGPLYAFSPEVNFNDYIASIDKLKKRLDEFDFLCSGHNDPWVKSEVIVRVADAFQEIQTGEGEFKEADGLRRYFFDGFDILIRVDLIKE